MASMTSESYVCCLEFSLGMLSPIRILHLEELFGLLFITQIEYIANYAGINLFLALIGSLYVA